MRTWWRLFALLIAAPAVALSVLGLRAVHADRLDRERQLRDQQSQTATIADAAIATVLDEFEAALRQSEMAWRAGGEARPLPGGVPAIVF